MVYVKIVKKKTGKNYYYLSQKYREEGKIKDKIIRKLSEEDIASYLSDKGKFLEKEIFIAKKLLQEFFVSPSSEIITTPPPTPKDDLRNNLQILIKNIESKKIPFHKSWRPQAFATTFLIPLLE